MSGPGFGANLDQMAGHCSSGPHPLGFWWQYSSMAGVRHHIVPQFLLRGFASRRKGKKAFTWVYRRDSKTFESSIRDIAVSKHFYGKDDTNADDAITGLESDFAVLVNDLRNWSGPIKAANLPALIIHLSTRTKGFRDNVTSVSGVIVAELQRHLEQPENMKEALLRRVKKEVDELLKKNRVPRARQRMFRAILERQVRVSIEKNKANLATLGVVLMGRLRAGFPEIAKLGHNKALLRLRQLPDDSVRKGWYEQFSWRVDVTNAPLILSDAMCLFRCGHDRFRILDDAEHMATGIFLPIATNRVLIGTHDDHLTANVEALNDVSAKCSNEYFVASNLRSEYEARIPLIGSWSKMLSENELEQLLAELTQDL